MINAFEMRHIALACAAYRRAAMRAAVHNDMEALVLVPRHNDRRVADEGRFEITGVRDFGLERNEVPGGAAEEMLLFGLVKGIIREHGIWYPAANGLLGVGRHFTYGRILNIEHKIGRASCRERVCQYV